MKRQLLTALIIFIFSTIAIAQSVISYKIKTKDNSKERAQILDTVRRNLYRNYHQEFVFVVKKINVYKGYAWLEVEVQRKDNKPVKVDEDIDDCCHVEALLNKKDNIWRIIEIGAFSTDVWWERLWIKLSLPQNMFL